MKKTLLPILGALLLLAATAVLAQEVCGGCEWGPRGDRSEGVKTKSLMISGGSFELLSVAYQSTGAGGSGSRLHLSFWMPEPKVLDEIGVWSPMPSPEEREKVSYRMEPDRKEYGAGRQDFSWPRGDVIDRVGLPLGTLNVLIKSGSTYFPGFLAPQAAAAPADGYAFVFESSAGIDTDCVIARADSGASVRSMECYEEMGGTIVIPWDGRDDGGQPAADGAYVLRIEGDMLAETIRPLEASVPFWHLQSPR